MQFRPGKLGQIPNASLEEDIAGKHLLSEWGAEEERARSRSFPSGQQIPALFTLFDFDVVPSVNFRPAVS